MKKKFFGLLILIAGLLFWGINAFSAGDLIVDGKVQTGQLQVTGEVRIYRLSNGCLEGGVSDAQLTTNTTCLTKICDVSEGNTYWTCSGSPCNQSSEQTCTTVYVGKLFP